MSVCAFIGLLKLIYMELRLLSVKAMVLLLLAFCLLLLPFWESVIVLCFVVRYFMSILVLQSSDGSDVKL